jgi:predicted dehydrogenase/threonine dehydrogenase-like Zn-dependent dehydrogenase
MLQVVQYQKNGEMQVLEMPAPACISGGILVQVAYSVISAGTEKTSVTNAQGNLLERAKKQPDQVKLVLDTVKKQGLINTIQRVQSKLNSYKSLGYSASGVVVESKCDEFKPGDLVAVAGAGYANHAEVVSIPKNLAIKIPEGVSLEEAAYTTVASIAMQGFRQAEPQLGETVAVMGLGLLGQITIQLLKSAGCRVIGLDVNESLFETAKKYGCDLTLQNDFNSLQQINSFARGLGCDSVIITASTSSHDPIQLAMEMCRQRGTVVIVGAIGMNMHRQPFYKKEINLKISCSYGPGRYDASYEEGGNDYPAAYVRWTENRNMISILDMIASKRLDVASFTTHKFKINDATKAYDLITNKTGERFLGVVLEYPERKEALSQSISLRNYQGRSQVKIGFIGAGQFAQNYLLPPLKNLGVDFLAVANSTSVNSLTVAKQFGFAISSTHGGEVIANKDVNLVFCATRHNSHAKYVIESLKADKDIFVEKPLAIDISELNEIKNLVNSKNGRVMVGFNRRFSKPFIDIKKFFANRSEPMNISYRVNAGMIPKSHWVQQDEQNGRIIGEACHFIDTMIFLTGSLPIRVYAESLSASNKEVMNEDNVAVIIKFADGSVGKLEYLANGDSSVPKEFCEVFCERATAVMNNFTQVTFHKSNNTKTNNYDGKKGIDEEVSATINAVKSGKEMPISFVELEASTLTTFAILESLQKAAVVEI